MDILVPIPMKSAAKCDTQCELQNSANHQILERNWRWGDILPACLFQCLITSKLIIMCLTREEICSQWLLTFFLSLTWKMYVWVFGSIELVTDSSVISIGNPITRMHIEAWFYIISNICIWNQARTPAELKHITKRRKRN